MFIAAWRENGERTGRERRKNGERTERERRENGERTGRQRETAREISRCHGGKNHRPLLTDVQPRKQLHKARDRGDGFHRVVGVQPRQRQPKQIDQPWKQGIRGGSRGRNGRHLKKERECVREKHRGSRERQRGTPRDTRADEISHHSDVPTRSISWRTQRSARPRVLGGHWSRCSRLRPCVGPKLRRSRPVPPGTRIAPLVGPLGAPWRNRNPLVSR